MNAITKKIDNTKEILGKFVKKHKYLKRISDVQSGFNDDKGNIKVGYITYFMFLSILPMIIATLTVLDLIFDPKSEFRKKLVDSTLSSILAIGPTLQSNLSFVKGHGVTLAVTLLIIIWSVRNGALVLQEALTSVLTKKDIEKSFLAKQLQAFAAMAIISVGIVAPTIVQGLVGKTLLLRLLMFIASCAWTTLVIYLIFRILVDKKHARGYGPVFGGITISIVQFLSVLILNHTLDNSRPLYGTLAIVLALMFWISLQVKILLYAAEVNATK